MRSESGAGEEAGIAGRAPGLANGGNGHDGSSATGVHPPVDADESAPAASKWFAWFSGLRRYLGVTSLTVVGILALALFWAIWHRGMVRLVPFEGPDGVVLALRLGRALDDVKLGAKSQLEVTSSAEVDADVVPGVSVPGLGLSFESLVGLFQFGWLAETVVRGALVEDGQHNYRIWLQVRGPRITVRTIGTTPTPDLDAAFLDAAQALYGVLQPIVLGAYLYTRFSHDADRRISVLRDVLADPASSPEDKAAAYQIWGIVLRDQEDFEGAREKLDQAIQGWQSLIPDRGLRRGEAPPIATRSGRIRRGLARAYVDRGHTYLFERRWADAIRDYRQAAAVDTGWHLPHQCLGDALRDAGSVKDAIAEYEDAARLAPLALAPLAEIARTQMEQQDYREAFAAYRRAAHLIVPGDRDAIDVSYGLGDAFFALGLRSEAAGQYERAADIEPAGEDRRQDWQLASACQLAAPVPPPDGDVPSPVWRTDP